MTRRDVAARVCLLDVNVLVALCWPSHMHHALVQKWFFEDPTRHWGSCALTELGFIRLSSNTKVTPDAVTPPQATALLRRACAATRHSYWATAPSVVDLPIFGEAGLVGHRQVTDAYLLALAEQAQWTLVTLDRGLKAFADARPSQPSPVEWIGP
jgi:uncharacterized protein